MQAAVLFPLSNKKLSFFNKNFLTNNADHDILQIQERSDGMNWNQDKSISLSQGCVCAFALLLAGLGLRTAVRGWTDRRWAGVIPGVLHMANAGLLVYFIFHALMSV